MVQTHTTTVGHTPAPRTLRYTPPAEHFVAVPTTSNFTGGGSGIARGMALHEVSKTDCNKGYLQTIFSRRTHTYVLTDMCGATTWCPFVKCSHAAAHPVDGNKVTPRRQRNACAAHAHTNPLRRSLLPLSLWAFSPCSLLLYFGFRRECTRNFPVPDHLPV